MARDSRRPVCPRRGLPSRPRPRLSEPPRTGTIVKWDVSRSTMARPINIHTGAPHSACRRLLNQASQPSRPRSPVERRLRAVRNHLYLRPSSTCSRPSSTGSQRLGPTAARMLCQYSTRSRPSCQIAVDGRLLQNEARPARTLPRPRRLRMRLDDTC